MNRNVLLTSHLCLYSKKRFPAGRWSFLGPGSETKWHSTDKERPGGEWDRDDELMMITFGESGHPVLRATGPLSRGTLKSKGDVKLSIHFCADGDTIETFSHNHFCQSAQYLRSSLRFVWRLQYLSNKHRKTCCDRTIRSIFCVSRLIYNEIHSLNWDSCTRKSIAEAQRTSGKASTTRSID